jgi:hypothetical protein
MDAYDPFDPEYIGVSAESLSAPSRLLPRHHRGQKFLKGPIPWNWLSRAALLPGRALAVALVLWRDAGMRRCRRVPFRLRAAAGLGISRSAARRGLRALEVAGLVTVERPPGLYPQVTLRDVEDEP